MVVGALGDDLGGVGAAGVDLTAGHREGGVVIDRAVALQPVEGVVQEAHTHPLGLFGVAGAAARGLVVGHGSEQAGALRLKHPVGLAHGAFDDRRGLTLGQGQVAGDGRRGQGH